jgi:hypothetical protein
MTNNIDRSVAKFKFNISVTPYSHVTTNPNLRQAVAIASTQRGRCLVGVSNRPVESLVVAGLYSRGVKYV